MLILRIARLIHPLTRVVLTCCHFNLPVDPLLCMDSADLMRLQ